MTSAMRFSAGWAAAGTIGINAASRRMLNKIRDMNCIGEMTSRESLEPAIYKGVSQPAMNGFERNNGSHALFPPHEISASRSAPQHTVPILQAVLACRGKAGGYAPCVAAMFLTVPAIRRRLNDWS